MQLLPGKELANELLETLKNKITQTRVQPKLSILQVGEEEPSNIYVNKKLEVSREIGIITEVFKYSSGQDELIRSKINQLNEDTSVNGIIVQLPTPGTEILNLLNFIHPNKDVDGLTSNSLGRNWYHKSASALGATPKAIFYILEYISKQQNQTVEQLLSGKNVLIINHNILIGKPLAGVLLNHQSTVTIAHSQTDNLEQLFSYADIIVTATGQNIINQGNADSLKDGVIIIDSGFARLNGKSFGDVDLEAVRSKASWLTPVPGGIGPLGVAMLMQNTYEAFTAQNHPLQTRF